MGNKKKIDEDLLIKFKSINKQKNKGNTKKIMPSQSAKDKLKKLEKQQLETAKRAQLAKIARRKLLAGKPIVSAKRTALGRTSSIPMVKKKVKKTGGAEPKAKTHLQGVQVGQIVKHKTPIGANGDIFKVIKNNPKTIVGKSTKTGKEIKISKMNISATRAKSTTTSAIRSMGTDIGGRIRGIQKARDKDYKARDKAYDKKQRSMSQKFDGSNRDSQIANRVYKTGEVIKIFKEDAKTPLDRHFRVEKDSVGFVIARSLKTGKSNKIPKTAVNTFDWDGNINYKKYKL